MSKSLKIMQTVAKVARIVCKVLFILCLVGAGGSLIALVATIAIGPLFETSGMSSVSTTVVGCAVGLFSCVGEAILFRMGERYFEHELAAGTPFTQDGAKEIFRWGIASIIVSVAVSVASGIVMALALIFSSSVAEPDVTMSWSLGSGLMLLLLSVIFRHGAELAELAYRPRTEWQASAEEKPREETAQEAPTEDTPKAEASAADGEGSETKSFDVL